MKRLFPLFLILCLAACAPAAIPTLPPPTNASIPVATSIPPSTASAKPLLTAHRGGAGLAPENTLAAFRNAIALGVDAVELDVHLSRDGQVVVMHDPNLERTTDGHGQIYDQTLAELQKLNAAAKYSGKVAPEPVPTLSQVLDLFKDRRERVEIEIKVPPQGRYPGIEQKVLDEIKAHNLSARVQISSFDFPTIAEVHRLDATIPTVALLSTDYFRRVDLNQPARVIQEVQDAGANIIGVNKDLLTPPLISEAHKRGLKTQVWTVDNPDEMSKFIDLNVDGITTNRPDLLKSLLAQ